MAPVTALNIRDTAPYQARYRSAAMADEASVLAAIYREQINIAIWQRQLDTGIAGAVTDLLASVPDERRWQATVSPGSSKAWLHTHLPRFSGKTLLLKDIVLLVDMFSCLFDLNNVGLRLAILESAMCPRFHTDRTLCRLVTTYAGPGTQWCAQCEDDRTQQAGAGAECGDGLSGMDPHEQSIHQVNVGEVALLKGESWEGNEGRGLVHRSPQIEHGSRRLLLTLDMM